MGRIQISFGGCMSARSTKTITNINIVSSWAMGFFHKVSKKRFVNFRFKIQRTKVCELQIVSVMKRGKMIHVK